MTGYQYFHGDYTTIYFFFPSFKLTSASGLVIAYACTALMCFGERSCSYFLETYQYSASFRIRDVLIKSSGYLLATILRYLIMLLIMSYHSGIFIITVLSLSLGQCVIEYIKASNTTHLPIPSSDNSHYSLPSGTDNFPEYNKNMSIDA
ncbi:hypothetical protein K493DRAFT_312462 [Basidiobolus meristosporus CBS 931.73]|uniref:Copper transport protein n=1 Tax=Basidiobolus meristosporus CBS 931.73 TaxID=1314790 RepID=A0A1Y1YUA5_9FUNG|nr:hypothetical protein K493DRAFT_312462 [Basidiobolus meristosporus CBS 931.73]|eukprot:ORY01414.1 hypothetical protein K493DRAFT_312462 [Basidiobolus meristosporus CBS 931.73]